MYIEKQFIQIRLVPCKIPNADQLEHLLFHFEETCPYTSLTFFSEIHNCDRFQQVIKILCMYIDVIVASYDNPHFFVF